MKHESSYEDDYMNGDMHARHSLPNHFSVGSSHLQDIAFSAQQALARGDDDIVPVDPALQAYANGAFSAMDMTPSYPTNGDEILSSIEQQAEGDMDGIEFAQHNGQPQGPSMEPLTPGPPPHNQTIQAQSNGYPDNDTIHVQPNGFQARHTIHAQRNGFAASDTIHVQPNGYSSKSVHEHNAVRHPSSPVSPRNMSAVSPGTHNYNPYMVSPTMNHNNHYNFTADSDFPPPPITPSANVRAPHSSGRKASQTPSRARASKTPKSTPNGRRRDSKDGIKLEAGLGVGINSMMDLMIDPNLDQASKDLIKQLQQEDLGLRRRAS
jgi:F-box/leucine-rich repeat protein 10/11